LLDKIQVGIRTRFQFDKLKRDFEPVFHMMEERKARWYEMAKDKPSLYQYLKDNIHTDKNE